MEVGFLKNSTGWMWGGVLSPWAHISMSYLVQMLCVISSLISGMCHSKELLGFSMVK